MSSCTNILLHHVRTLCIVLLVLYNVITVVAKDKSYSLGSIPPKKFQSDFKSHKLIYWISNCMKIYMFIYILLIHCSQQQKFSSKKCAKFSLRKFAKFSLRKCAKFSLRKCTRFHCEWIRPSLTIVMTNHHEIWKKWYCWVKCQGPILQSVCEFKIRILWKLVLADYDYNDQIKPKFCTCPDSWAVGTCEKFWHDLNIIFWDNTSRNLFIILWVHTHFVRWFTGLKASCFPP